MLWTYIFISWINPIGLGSGLIAILKLYGVNLNFSNPNFNLNCYVMMLTPGPPSNKTSSTIFSPIYTWIIATWLSIAIATITTFGTTYGTIFL
jgi:hypothetical protein